MPKKQTKLTPPHPCQECGRVTKRPKFCSQRCGQKWWSTRKQECPMEPHKCENEECRKYTVRPRFCSKRCSEHVNKRKHRDHYRKYNTEYVRAWRKRKKEEARAASR